MEELQSTEILDREILEDARKKAYKILKTADETVEAQTKEWENKASASLDELKLKYRQQRKISAQEIMVHLPIEKRRIRAQTVEKLLSEAVENWFSALGHNRVFDIIKNKLKRRLEECGGLSVFRSNDESNPNKAYFYKLTASEAEEILQSLLPGGKFLLEEYKSSLPFPEITIENNFVRITASINKELDFLVHENRAELIEALLGEQFLADEVKPEENYGTVSCR